jgi:TonB family protein
MSSKWLDGFARSLIQHAARTAPESLAERLEEEWLADFEGRRGPLARLRFGVGCCWATRVIAHEYLEPKVAAAATGTTTGSKVMTAFAQSEFSFLSRRSSAFLAIIGVHAAIIYCFATGLAQTALKNITPPMVTKMVDSPKVVERPPELTPQTTFTPQHIAFDPMVPKFETDSSNAPTDVAPIVEEPHVPVPTITQPKAVSRVAGGPGKGFPNTDDFYPADALRRGVSGAPTVQVCTDDKGRLTGAPTLVQTSGSTGLDDGALRLAKAGSGRYRASTEDGRAVSSCYSFRVVFHIRN